MPTILVVEDSEDLRDILRLALEAEGLLVKTAGNGKEGLVILNERPLPDLILLDLMMPVMNGWEFLLVQRADSELSKIPVVVCSATRDSRIGDVDFLQKPIDLSDLNTLIQRYLS